MSRLDFTRMDRDTLRGLKRLYELRPVVRCEGCGFCFVPLESAASCRKCGSKRAQRDS